MKKGELWYSGLNPRRGGEQAGYGPVRIISRNLLNDHAPGVICCPLTSKLKHYHGNVILKAGNTTGLKKEYEILTFQIHALSKTLLIEKIGRITEDELNEVQECLNDILKY